MNQFYCLSNQSLGDFFSNTLKLNSLRSSLSQNGSISGFSRIFFIILFSFISIFTQAATITTSGNGNWSSTTPNAPWPGGVIPAAGDDVIIGNGYTLTVDGNRTCNSFGFGTGPSSASGTLIVNAGFQLTVTTLMAAPGLGLSSKANGDYNISGLGTISCADFWCNNNTTPGGSSISTIKVYSTIAALNVTNELILNATVGGGSKRNDPTFNLQSGTVTVRGSLRTLNGGSNNISTLDLVTSAASPVLNLVAAAPFNLSGTGTNTINVNGTDATVNYSGSVNQPIYTTTYTNLHTSGSGTKTQGGDITVAGNLNIGTGTTYDGSAFTTTMSGTGWRILNSGTLNFNSLTIAGTPTTQSSSSYNVAGILTVNSGITLAPIAGTITRTGTAWTSVFTGTANLFNYTIAGTPATQPSGSLSIAGILTVNSGITLAPIGGTMTMSGTSSGISNNGTLNFFNLTIAATPTAQSQYNSSYAVNRLLTVNTGITFAPSGGTITRSGTLWTTTLTAAMVTFYHYTIAGSPATSPTATYAVAGTFTVNAATNFAATAGTVTMTSTTSAITNNGTLSFFNLTANNSSGLTVTSATAVTINNVLNFLSGVITPSTSLTIAAAGTITNATSTSYVNGKLNIIYSGIGNKIFQIGKGGNYRPVTFEYFSLTGTSTLSFEQFESQMTGTLPGSANIDPNRYWDYSQTGGSSFTYKVTLNPTSFAVTGTVVLLKKDAGTITSNAATTPNYTNTTNFSVISAPTSIALGCDCAATSSNAGANQTGAATCGLTTVTLAGNTPTYGTGLWTIVSGAGGSFGNASSAGSTFSGTAGTAYTLRWTITNGNCSVNSTVNITFNQSPTTANAGANQTGAATCGLTSVNLAANTPTVGTGAWSIVSGGGGTVTTPTSPTSTFTGTAGTAYTLRWTISNSPCTASASDVNITFNISPTTANAGPNQTGAATCGLTSVNLAANTPTVGTGAWSIVSGGGGTVTTPTSPTSTFTGTAGTAYTLRWTISNSPCTASTSDVNISFNQNLTTANAGANQTGAATCGLTLVTLAANTPSVGTGAWSIVSGAGGTVTTPTSPTSTFTGTAGTAYTLRWTISNSPCTASTSDVNITFNQNPTTANAGANQTGAATCGLTSVNLAANTPTVGTGAWSIVSGGGGTVTTPTSPTSTFTGTAGTAYTLRWTISNSPCTASASDVNITFNISPTTANAGANQTGAATCGLTLVTLAANTPTVGTGAWSIVSGAGGTVTTPTSPTSTFTGTAGTAYTLRWTISNSPCTSSTSDVNLTFNQNPTTANAGANQTGAATCGLTSVTLAANTPTVGTGAWSIVSGAGGTVTTPTSPTSTFTGTAGTAYTLRWTISNSPCTVSTSDVNISFNENTIITGQPVAATLCSGQSQTFNVTATGTGITYQWRKAGVNISGATASSYNIPSVTAGDAANYDVVITGTCNTVISATVTLSVNTVPSITTQPLSQDICSGETVVFSVGVSAGSGTGISYQWKKDNVNINGETAASYTIATAYVANAGNYTVEVTSCGSMVTSAAAILSFGSKTWLGVNTDWHDGQNWCGGIVPGPLANVEIPVTGTTFYPVVSAAAHCSSITIDNNASLTINNGQLQIGTFIINNGTFTATTGSIEFNGTAAQTIPANTFAGNSIKDIIISNDAGVTLSGELGITGTLTLNNGSITTGDHLILKSSATGSARIAQLPVDGGGVATAFINGKVTIERYIPARKAWRLMTAPVKSTGAPSINAAWQEGLTTSSSNPNLYPGYGVFIQGGTVANGFDQGATSTPSIKYYSNAANNFLALPASPGTNAAITAYPGYFIYIRGDRGINLLAGNSAAITATTLRAKGAINTGNVTTAVNATKYTVLGNPYPSAIDFETITKTNVKNSFYVWDPKLSGAYGLGGYVSFSWNSGTSSYDNTTSVSPLSKYIQSGEAIIVESDDGVSPGSITIKESDKSANGSDGVFGRYTGPPQRLRVNLYAINADASRSLLDGVLTTYDDNNSNNIDHDDVKKLNGGSENIGIKRSGTMLAMERRTTITSKDTTFLNLYQMKIANYQLEITADKLDANKTVAVIKDSYSNTINNIQLNPNGTTVIPFSINSDPASYAIGRFSIVFVAEAVVALPVSFKTIKADRRQKTVVVNWTTENELNVKHYEVEHSLDGRNFEKINTTTATAVNGGNAAYKFTHNSPLNGLNYYRIRSVDLDGKTGYSSIVKTDMQIENTTTSIVVYPNPVTGNTIGLQMNNLANGIYTLQLFNSNGQLLAAKTLQQNGSTRTENFDVNENFVAGKYELILKGEGIQLNTPVIKR